MNPHIKSLVEETGFILESDQDHLGESVPDEFVKKFAELIVRECAGVARHDAVRKMSGEDIAGMIEMHFGVKS